uniref:Fucosyltransferase n=1 Tax=Davidia involucrata TaxID=16924 RepID=A0A5B6ZDC8_DAVIN
MCFIELVNMFSFFSLFQFTVSGDDSSRPLNTHNNELLGGLLAAGFDKGSCLSRYQSTLYRKMLKSGQNVGPMDCNYVVWISFSGLGNKILTLAFSIPLCSSNKQSAAC